MMTHMHSSSRCARCQQCRYRQQAARLDPVHTPFEKIGQRIAVSLVTCDLNTVCHLSSGSCQILTSSKTWPSCLWKALGGGREEVEQVSSPSTRVAKAESFCGKRRRGELPTCLHKLGEFSTKKLPTLASRLPRVYIDPMPTRETELAAKFERFKVSNTFSNHNKKKRDQVVS